MTALALLQQLRELGVELTPSPDGTVHYRAPKGILTPALLDEMRQSKAALHGLVEDLEERIALAIYEGGLPESEAEQLAWQCVLGETPGQPRRTAVPVHRGDDDAREEDTTTQLYHQDAPDVGDRRPPA